MSGLYDRDYTVLTDEEKEIFKEYSSLATTIEDIGKPEAADKQRQRMELVLEHDFIHRHVSLFPNNYFEKFGFDTDENKSLLEEFKALIDNQETGEQELLNFIRDRKAYFIIASLLDYKPFGHHNRALFREFPLGTEYAADFLLIGKNSYGYHFIFIELEAVNGATVIGDGAFGNLLRKGIDQVKDWKHFLERDYTSLKSIYNRYKNPSADLPKEFYEYDNTKMYYVVIGGRRIDFNEKTRRLAEEERRGSGIEIIHYDRLYEYAEGLVEKGRF